MVEEIKDYILNNWHKLGINASRPKELFTLQISKSHIQPYEKGKIIHLIFKDNEGVPFCAAKFYRDIGFQNYLEEEVKILKLLQEKGFNLAPRSLHSTFLKGHFLSIESFCIGHSQILLLQNFAYSKSYSQSGLDGLLKNFTYDAVKIHNELNTLSQESDNSELNNEIEKLLSEYRGIFDVQDAEKRLIEFSVREILEEWNMPVKKRLVYCDMVPDNIICSEFNIYLLDWEHVKLSSCLTLLEPTRYIFYLMRYLYKLGILTADGGFIGCFNQCFNTSFWFCQILLDFFRNTINYKAQDEQKEISYYRRLFLLFFLYESVLQYNVSKYLWEDSIEELKSYVNLISGYYPIQQQEKKIREMEPFYNKVKKSFAYKAYSFLFHKKVKVSDYA